MKADVHVVRTKSAGTHQRCQHKSRNDSLPQQGYRNDSGAGPFRGARLLNAGRRRSEGYLRRTCASRLRVGTSTALAAPNTRAASASARSTPPAKRWSYSFSLSSAFDPCPAPEHFAPRTAAAPLLAAKAPRAVPDAQHAQRHAGWAKGHSRAARRKDSLPAPAWPGRSAPGRPRMGGVRCWVSGFAVITDCVGGDACRANAGFSAPPSVPRPITATEQGDFDRSRQEQELGEEPGARNSGGRCRYGLQSDGRCAACRILATNE